MFDILDMMDTMTWLHVEYFGLDGLFISGHGGSAGNGDWTCCVENWGILETLPKAQRVEFIHQSNCL